MAHLSVSDAARRVGIKNRTILGAIQSGRLSAKKTESGEFEVDSIGLFRLVGSMYDNGRGVAQDFANAAKWYRRAAEEGDTVSQTYLGFLYYCGRGVPQNDVLAHMWFSLSAANGSKTAAETRDSIGATMSPDQIAEARRLASEWKPNGGIKPAAVP